MIYLDMNHGCSYRVQIQEVGDLVEDAVKISAFDKKLPYLR